MLEISEILHRAFRYRECWNSLEHCTVSLGTFLLEDHCTQNVGAVLLSYVTGSLGSVLLEPTVMLHREFRYCIAGNYWNIAHGSLDTVLVEDTRTFQRSLSTVLMVATDILHRECWYCITGRHWNIAQRI